MIVGLPHLPLSFILVAQEEASYLTSEDPLKTGEQLSRVFATRS